MRVFFPLGELSAVKPNGLGFRTPAVAFHVIYSVANPTARTELSCAIPQERLTE